MKHEKMDECTPNDTPFSHFSDEDVYALQTTSRLIRETIDERFEERWEKMKNSFNGEMGNNPTLQKAFRELCYQFFSLGAKASLENISVAIEVARQTEKAVTLKEFAQNISREMGDQRT